MKFKLAFIFFLFLLAFLLSLFSGPFGIGYLSQDVFLQLRVPRTLSALFVGASLGLSGMVFQYLLQNPLAEPYTLGISGGASLGILFSFIFSFYPIWFFLPLFASIGCLVSTLAILLIAKKLGGFNQKSLILSGIIISLFCSSILFISFSFLKAGDYQQVITWLMGYFGSHRDLWWPYLMLLFVGCFSYVLLSSKKLDYFLLGEDISFSFLKKKNEFRFKLVLVLSLLIALCVSIAGIVAFVGLLAPHLSYYLLKTNRTKYLAIASSLMGASLLLISDSLSRLLSTLGLVPSATFVVLIGAPFMLYLLIREDSAHES